MRTYYICVYLNILFLNFLYNLKFILTTQNKFMSYFKDYINKTMPNHKHVVSNFNIVSIIFNRT